MANILLAEDDDPTRFYLKSSLEREGHSVTACADGLEAALALSDQSFDLLLTDIVMPGMDGVELSTRAKTLYPALKIVFITGFAGMVAGDKSLEKPIVIAKPFHLAQLIEEVNGILKG